MQIFFLTQWYYRAAVTSQKHAVVCSPVIVVLLWWKISVRKVDNRSIFIYLKKKGFFHSTFSVLGKPKLRCDVFINCVICDISNFCIHDIGYMFVYMFIVYMFIKPVWEKVVSCQFVILCMMGYVCIQFVGHALGISTILGNNNL